MRLCIGDYPSLCEIGSALLEEMRGLLVGELDDKRTSPGMIGALRGNPQRARPAMVFGMGFEISMVRGSKFEV